MSCPTETELVNERITRVLTQYRESPKLLHLLRTYLGAVAALHLEVCDLPDLFEIERASGDQLTLLGKRLGWPRCHCVCDVQPVFGFDCPDEVTLRPVVGFGGTTPNSPFGFCSTAEGFCSTVPVSWDACPQPDLTQAANNSTWANCASGLSELCINDDALYRSFLRVRRYQFMRMYDLASLETCLHEFFGTSATVLYHGQGRIVVAPGRDLTDGELLMLQLYPRVLPVALGIKVMFHFGELRVFGFGDGWGGLSEERPELTQTTQAFQRSGKVFGFCDEFGGFCEEWEPDGLPLLTEAGEPILDESGQKLYTGPLTEHAAWMCREGAPWMCEVDVRPYDC